jgi:hypothetical protein
LTGSSLLVKTQLSAGHPQAGDIISEQRAT